MGLQEFTRLTLTSWPRKASARDSERPIDADTVVRPPYYPDLPLVRRDWANGLETVQVVDRQVGGILKQLEDDGLADNTIVFFIGDHGRCHIRGKQFLYEGGVRIPLIVRWPRHINHEVLGGVAGRTQIMGAGAHG
jgi:N-sulfoglucosamine sulfohydrolase